MTRRRDPATLLRWYPPAWRDRYGDEFVACVEDTLGETGARLTARMQVSIACAGLRERALRAGLAGDQLPPDGRVRAGALLVLCAWAAFVVAGVAFSKLSEQFDTAVPAAARALPWGAFRAVQIVAVVATVAVMIGVLLAVPAFWRFIRGGGWAAISGHVARATVATVAVLATTVGLVAWAHSLSFGQRNGGDGPFELAFLAWALLVATTLGLWTVAGVAVGRRLVLTPGILTAQAALAGVVTAAMTTMTIAVAIWWTAMATRAPWFLHGTATGSSGSAFEPRLAATMAIMLGAVIAASYGTIRAARSWHDLRAAQ